MSDGEVDATLGHSHAAPDDRPTEPRSAPRRGSGSPSRPPMTASTDGRLSRPPRPRTLVEAAELPARRRKRPVRHAAGALSVADLIAKVGANTTGTRHRRADLDDEPPRTRSGCARRPAGHPGHRIPAYSLDVPRRFPTSRSRTTRTATSPSPTGPPRYRPRRARPSRSGSADANLPRPSPKHKSRRRPILLAGRSMAALFAVLALVLTGGAWQWSTSKNNRLNTISALDPDSQRHRRPQRAVRRRETS